MDETTNLGLDVTEAPDGSRLVRVCMELACSYTREGEPTLTADCSSVDQFEREIARLKEECDELLAQARAAFAGTEPTAVADASAGGETAESAPNSEPIESDRIRLRIGDDLTVADEMTTDVKTMGRNDSLSVADELMKVGRFRHVVVIDDDGNEIVGVVSHRDIFYGALAWSTGQGELAHQKALGAVSAKQVMHTDVTTVAPDVALADAARIMFEQKIGCLPVVKDDQLVGILTEGDFLSMLTNAEYS